MTTATTEQLDHVRILASAGSGKTYQIITRYLRLLREDCPVSSILATTFTRAAAGDIRRKLLHTVAEAAANERAREELAERLKASTLTSEQSLDLLFQLTNNLHRLQVRTLDSFNGSIVRSFALELGIPPGSDIVDEDQIAHLRAEAIRLMLDERDPQKLVDLLRLLTQGASDRSVMAAIDRTLRPLYNLFREADYAAWECVGTLPGKLALPKLVEAIEALECYKIPETDKRLHKARQSDLVQARAHDWPRFIKRGIAAKVANDELTFYKKELDPQLVSVYRPLTDHAKAVLVGRLHDETVASRELLSVFHTYYEQVKHRAGAMTFDDVTTAMRRADDIGEMDAICFRLDATLHHLLLDEFQDTSISQWRGLEPIVREMVSWEPPERTFLCVGDVKQSIYGWRDAAPEVLEELHTLLMGPDGRSAIRDKTLKKSYRSAPVIINVVNTVFGSLDTNEALSEHPTVVKKWSDGFKIHTTDKTNLSGYAELLVAPRAEKDASQQTVRLRYAAGLVAKLHKRNPQLNIAVLTRKNEAVARLRFELGPSGHNIAVGGRGRGTLTDAPAVNTLLDLLQLADHPDDTTAAFNVAASPLGSLVQLHRYDSAKQRRDVAATVRRQLLDDGYTATLGSWVGALAASCDRRDLMRLHQLVDLSRQFEDRSTLRPADFVRFVQRVTVEETRPAPVQVMTIHQSKGLEFDIVVLADLETSVTGPTTPAVVYERDGETGPITRICRYVKKETRAFAPHLESMFDRHRQRTVRETLSLLYVAITRAKRGLHIIIDPPGENSKTIPKSLASVLRCALAETAIEPEQCAFSEGDLNWLDDAQPKPVAPDEDTEKLVELRLAPSSGTAPGTIASPSALAETNVASALRLPNEEALDRGTALHGMLEQITWLDDWQPNERILRTIAKRAAPRRSDVWVRQMLESFAQLIKCPAVQKVLGLNGRDPNTLRVLREQPFVRLVDGAIQRGMIDRLEIETIEDKPLSATVIDFKTDLITPEQAQATAEHYRPQLEAYRAAAAQLLDVKPALVRMIVLFVTAGEAVELG